MRCFIGVPVVGNLADRCASLSKSIRDATPKDNLHLTLAFLGDHSRDLLNQLHAPLCALANEHASFVQPLYCCEPFPSQEGPFMALTGEACGSLQKLYLGLTECLRTQGFTLDERLFRPHITLAKPGSASVPKSVPGEWSLPVTSLWLYRSELGGPIPDYEPLAQFPLSAEF